MDDRILNPLNIASLLMIVLIYFLLSSNDTLFKSNDVVCPKIGVLIDDEEKYQYLINTTMEHIVDSINNKCPIRKGGGGEDDETVIYQIKYKKADDWEYIVVDIFNRSNSDLAYEERNDSYKVADAMDQFVEYLPEIYDKFLLEERIVLQINLTTPLGNQYHNNTKTFKDNIKLCKSTRFYCYEGCFDVDNLREKYCGH